MLHELPGDDVYKLLGPLPLLPVHVMCEEAGVSLWAGQPCMLSYSGVVIVPSIQASQIRGF